MLEEEGELGEGEEGGGDFWQGVWPSVECFWTDSGVWTLTSYLTLTRYFIAVAGTMGVM